MLSIILYGCHRSCTLVFPIRRIPKIAEVRKISALLESCLKTNYWYLQSSEETSVLDPDSMNPDRYGSGCNESRPFRIRIQHFKWIPFLGLHKGRPSYRSSHQPSKENIKHFKRWKLTVRTSIFLVTQDSEYAFLYWYRFSPPQTKKCW
jgi:hypothetical protein